MDVRETAALPASLPHRSLLTPHVACFSFVHSCQDPSAHINIPTGLVVPAGPGRLSHPINHARCFTVHKAALTHVITFHSAGPLPLLPAPLTPLPITHRHALLRPCGHRGLCTRCPLRNATRYNPVLLTAGSCSSWGPTRVSHLTAAFFKEDPCQALGHIGLFPSPQDTGHNLEVSSAVLVIVRLPVQCKLPQRRAVVSLVPCCIPKPSRAGGLGAW